jgi:hypothetical protein
MRRVAPVRQDRGGPFRAEDAERRSPLPLRATGLVLAGWILALVFGAFVIVPLAFATCLPPTPAG